MIAERSEDEDEFNRSFGMATKSAFYDQYDKI